MNLNLFFLSNLKILISYNLNKYLKMNKLLVLLVLLSLQLSAQKTLKYANEDADYEQAVLMFDLKKYSIAQKKFAKVAKRIEDEHSEIKMSAEYHEALCALELFNDDAEQMFLDFIKNHPQNPKIRKARFQLGRYNYRLNNWKKTIEWLSQVEPNDLENYELSEYYFKYGYANLKQNDAEKAEGLFFEAQKDTASVYGAPALFYYAHIQYENNKLDPALSSFKKLVKHPDFEAVAPYYIVQIYYLQKKYDDLIAYAPGLLESGSARKADEISRMLGEAYYEKNDFKNAAIHLKFFLDNTKTVDDQSRYQFAYALWKTGDYSSAKIQFQKTADIESLIGMMSLYYLGDIYLKEGNKKSARNAYRFSSKMDYDILIMEDALFNYAKLSYELDIDPYHESIIAMETYIKKFPQSLRVDEAKKYLLNVYLNTKNYEKALTALEGISNKNLELQYAYQKISYYRGVELFNNQKISYGKTDGENFKMAIKMFENSAKYPVDDQISALCLFWIAESNFRLDNFDLAISYYNRFKNARTAILLPEFKNVEYSLAYAHLGKLEYGPAIRSFRNYILADKTIHPKTIDARIRIADGFLILRNSEADLKLAIDHYQQVIQANQGNVDYAYFQKSQAYRLLNEYPQQVDALEELITKFPNSKYAGEARLNIGETYLKHIRDYPVALSYFNELIAKNTNNILLHQKALINAGFAYRLQKDYEKALDAFEKSVFLNTQSKEAREGIIAHKETCENYVGNPEKHLSFRQKAGLPSLSVSEKDSTFYNAAKKHYFENDFKQAAKSFSTYLNDFNNPLFKTSAYYFLADSYLQLKDTLNAIVNYELLIAQPQGEYTENALFNTAQIYSKQKSFSKAITRYKALEEISNFDNYKNDAIVGLMNAYYAEADYKNTVDYAKKTVALKGVETNMVHKAYSVMGLAYLNLFEFDNAKMTFGKIADLQREIGAEANYNLAYIDYLQERYKESTDAVYVYIKKYQNFPYWVTKGFILISDNMVKQNDFFQAKYILKMVLDNNKNAELNKLAQDKLMAIDELEKAQLKKTDVKEENWQIGVEDEETKKLNEQINR